MARVTVTSGASSTIAGGVAVSQSVLVKNATGTASIYLEVDGDASASTSYEWAAADGPVSLDLRAGWVLKGRSAGADQTVHVLGSPD